MIDPITGQFEIMQYNDRRAILIANLFENTWLSRYPRPMEIKYGQGSQLIGHDMSKFLIEMEYKIVANPSILVTPMSNVILERIHQVLGNLVHTCNIKLTHVDEYDPRLGV